jgi:hypothetical protein
MMMKKWIVTAAILALSPVTAQAQNDDREQQWIYREKHGDGTLSPTAIFLSWNYASVIIRAECQVDHYGNPGKAGNGGITMHYYPGAPIVTLDEYGGYKEGPFQPFVFSRGGKSVETPAAVTSSAVTGNIAVTPELLNILKPGKEDLEIEATNEMDEPWYVGQAEPLYRLAQACAKK